MRMSFGGGELHGRAAPPPSKSHTHRAVFLAAMADGRSRLSNVLLSEDTKATIRASEAMGASFECDGGSLVADGGNLHPPSGTVDAANSGTTMRIFSGLASMFDSRVRIDGDGSLRKRPMGPLLDALAQTGTECTSDGGRPPVTVKGPNRGGSVRIDGGVSSQFITSLLMASPMLPNDSEITVEGNTISEPYLNVTTHMMGLFGADVKKDGRIFRVRGGTGYRPYDYRIPADFSSAAFPLVAGALGGDVTVEGLDMNDPQGDKAIVDILKRAGADVSVDGGSVTVRRSSLSGLEIDIGGVPDLFPVLAVLLSTAKGGSRLYGAPQLRFKESDRIRTTEAMLRAIGADIAGTDDGCIIHGKPALKGGRIENEGDHRIMMAAAVASLVCESPVEMENAECCAVSYPSFPEEMKGLGMRVV
ncbi:MAG: 3-phosphoshikimate 1-carboxyvinyltransferase [Candidatus Methanoplasma sp.]|jgi:3-phosphoshikimate 1-carboxyvinyltransferase|nr:3-phosphoshikimate 1-carboxyvinyltransferase [Candidatus Methanoplasma sp.]